jgi:hypothetical protein
MFAGFLSQHLPMKNEPVPLVDAHHAAFIRTGVSVSVGAYSQGKIPSQARATGCRVSSDRRRVSLFLSATQAADLLTDIRSNGAIAVVFSQPSSHRTVQLKGNDAIVGDLADDDYRIVDSYRDAFVQELEPLGFDPVMIRAMLACPPADLVAVSFTPAAAFSQTPGPNAGEPLKART